MGTHGNTKFAFKVLVFSYTGYSAYDVIDTLSKRSERRNICRHSNITSQHIIYL